MSIQFRVGLAALLLPLTAYAYVPPSHFIVKTLAMKHSSIKIVRVKSTVTSLDKDGKPGQAHFKVVTFYDAQTRTLRSWATDDADQKLYRMTRKEDAFLPADGLLFDSELRGLSQLLSRKGVPIKSEEELVALKDEDERRHSETSFLSRWKTTVAWVLGKRDVSPQLWVEKDSFLPIRYLAGPEGDGFTEVQFDTFRFHREFPYPALITVVQNTPLLKDEMTEVLVNPTPAELKLGPHEVGSGFTDAGNSAPTPVREMIDLYFRSVR